MQRLGRDRWVELVSEYKKSNLSRREFAQQHQISLHTLQFWLYKLQREANNSARFLPVNVVATAPKARPSTPEWLTVTLPSGLQFQVAVGTDCRYVANLLAALA